MTNKSRNFIGKRAKSGHYERLIGHKNFQIKPSLIRIELSKFKLKKTMASFRSSNTATTAFDDHQMVEEFNECEELLNIVVQKVRAILRDFREMNLWSRLLKDDTIVSTLSRFNDAKIDFQNQVKAMEDQLRRQLDEWQALFNSRTVLSFELNLRIRCSSIQSAVLNNLNEMKDCVKNFARRYAEYYEMIRSVMLTSRFKRLISNDNPTHWVCDREYTISDGTIEASDDDDDCVFLGYPVFPKKQRN